MGKTLFMEDFFGYLWVLNYVHYYVYIECIHVDIFFLEFCLTLS